MSERKLAHIELIESLHPIEGADKIEMAKILGWECVVKKDEFKVGDKVIYIEVDSVMPELPEYEFLKTRKYRIKTIKLKGQISQGLILPLPQSWTTKREDRCQIGSDVTEELGITKYLTPSEQAEINGLNKFIKTEKNPIKKFLMRYEWFRKLVLSRKKSDSFPSWVSKTDEERIQNLGDKFIQENANKVVYVTEKVDYQSVTFTGKMIPRFNGLLGKLIPFKTFKFIVCSRNITNNDKNSLYWKIAEKYNIENILREHPYLTIQGEQGSSSVQGNKYKIKEPTLWVFNIYNHEAKKYFEYYEMLNFCMRYNLTTVPYISFYKLSELGSTVSELVEYSKGYSIINPDTIREGVVIRCIEDGKKVISFKVINPEFLLLND